MGKSQYKFPSFKLGDVAEFVGVPGKMKMSLMDDEVDKQELREYNLNDCVVTLAIWEKEKIGHIIPSIAVCIASSVYDCCKYVTGTLTSLGYSSYCIA